MIHRTDCHCSLAILDPRAIAHLLREGQLGGFQTGGLPIFSGKGPNCVADPFGDVPCRCFKRPRNRKGQIGKIPAQWGKPGKKRESPKKDKKGKDKSRSGKPPLNPPPRRPALESWGLNNLRNLSRSSKYRSRSRRSSRDLGALRSSKTLGKSSAVSAFSTSCRPHCPNSPRCHTLQTREAKFAYRHKVPAKLMGKKHRGYEQFPLFFQENQMDQGDFEKCPPASTGTKI